jgi:hypothetical protein
MGMMMFFDGTLNSGLTLAQQGTMLKYFPRRNRTMYIATTNFLSTGITGAVAPYVAGVVITRLMSLGVSFEVGIYTFTGFHLIFLISAVLRAGANLFAARIQEPGSLDARALLSILRRTNPITITSALYRLQEAREAGRDEELARAAERLGELRSPLAIRELVPLLQHELRPVRRAAAEALGKIGAAEASEPLAQALFQPDLEIQTPAARALGEIGDFRSLKALIEGLRRLDSEALCETIDSLALIGDGAAILPLVCLYQDVEDPALRRQIAAALRKLCKTESVEEVVAILSPTRHSQGTPRP